MKGNRLAGKVDRLFYRIIADIGDNKGQLTLLRGFKAKSPRRVGSSPS